MQSLTTSQKEQLECYENDLKQSNLQLNKLRQSQVTEIDQRCRQVDILKQQLSDQLESLQHQRDSLVSHLKVKTSTLASSIEECNKLRHEIEELRVQLERSSEHASQLQNENATLHNQLKRSQRSCCEWSVDVQLKDFFCHKQAVPGRIEGGKNAHQRAK